MSEQKENGKRAKCPVCGRFAKAEAVDRYNGMLNERVRIAKELDEVAVELGEVRKALVEAQEVCSTAQKRAADYETLYINTRGQLDEACADIKKLHDRLADAGVKLVSMQSECDELHSENEKIYSRSLWARIVNKRV